MKNLREILIILFGLFVGLIATKAQDFRDQVKPEIAKFDFMIGEWTGEGWSMSHQGRETSTVYENIQYDLNGTIIRMEGKGVKMENGMEEVVHNAFGILSYDPFQKGFKINSWLAKGMSTTASVEYQGQGQFVWWFEAGPMTMRYTINVKDGVWNEIGEMSRDGSSWQQFFEMNLKRVQP